MSSAAVRLRRCSYRRSHLVMHSSRVELLQEKTRKEVPAGRPNLFVMGMGDEEADLASFVSGAETGQGPTPGTAFFFDGGAETSPSSPDSASPSSSSSRYSLARLRFFFPASFFPLVCFDELSCTFSFSWSQPEPLSTHLERRASDSPRVLSLRRA